VFILALLLPARHLTECTARARVVLRRLSRV